MPEQLFVNFCITVTFAFFRSLTFVTPQHSDTVVPQAQRGAITIANAVSLCLFNLPVGNALVDLSGAPIAALAFSNGPWAALFAVIPVLLFHMVVGDLRLDKTLSLLLTVLLVMVVRRFRNRRGPPTLLEGARNALLLFAAASLPIFVAAADQSFGAALPVYLTQVLGSAGALTIITLVMRSHLQMVGRPGGYRALVHLDPLTQVFNRRKFDEDLEPLPAQAYLLLLDLDHFKRVNDTHGHGVGDDVLKVTAQVVRDAVRETDRVYRLGGEEFAVLLPNCLSSAAQGIAERVRSSVEAQVAQRSGLSVPVTVSGGLTAAQGDKRALLGRADVLLYTAKDEGRNRIVAHVQDEETWGRV